jgi:phosphate transport system ATP-binding protein
MALAWFVSPLYIRLEHTLLVLLSFANFPKSIYENVAYGLRMRGENRRSYLDQKVEQALRSAALWNAVKDRLKDSASNLSGGQQQRCVLLVLWQLILS